MPDFTLHDIPDTRDKSGDCVAEGAFHCRRCLRVLTSTTELLSSCPGPAEPGSGPFVFCEGSGRLEAFPLWGRFFSRARGSPPGGPASPGPG
jgi:hypothetical protein